MSTAGVAAHGRARRALGSRTSRLRGADALLVATLALGGRAQGQVARSTPPLLVELGKLAPGSSVTTSVAPGRYRVRVDDRVLSGRYQVTVQRRALPISDLGAPFARSGQPAGAPDPECPALTAATTQVRAAATEPDVRLAVGAVRAALAAEGTKPGCKNAAGSARNVVELTTLDGGQFDLRAGEVIDVKVERLGDDGAVGATWAASFSTGPRGTWRATYGFAVVAARAGGGHGTFAKPSGYYTRQVADDQFEITREENRDGVDLVPMVGFTFLPTARETSAFSRGWQAGLGLDVTDPTVVLGYGVTYNQNVVLTLGGIVRRERVLLGRYREGDVVTTNLTEDQLYGRAFRVRPQLALTLRFSANPFAAPKEPAPAAAGGEPAGTSPAPTDGGASVSAAAPAAPRTAPFAAPAAVGATPRTARPAASGLRPAREAAGDR